MSDALATAAEAVVTVCSCVQVREEISHSWRCHRKVKRDLGRHSMIWRRWIERDDFRYSPVSFWPQQNKRLHQVLELPAELQRHSNVEFRAWKDQRCIVYLVSSDGIGKVVCLNFDAYAPVSRFESIAYAQLQIRGRLPRLQSDAEHLRDISLAALLPSLSVRLSLLTRLLPYSLPYRPLPSTLLVTHAQLTCSLPYT